MVRRTEKNNQVRKKKSIMKRIILSVLILAAVSVGAVYAYFSSQYSKVQKTEIPKTNDELSISDEAAKLDDDITNIALFGVDRRNQNDASRSDAIMILSLDKKHNKIKLSSIMRDTYVAVEGYGKTKINHAYAYGGPALAIKTINSNFNLNVKDYVTVDFEGMSKIIDAMGGVSINVKGSEIVSINECIDETNRVYSTSVKHITSKGVLKLNGAQAVAYSRIRNTGNGDYERTDRQRIVLTAILEGVKSAGITKFPAMVSSMLPYMETSLGQGDVLKLGTSVFTSNMGTIDQERFPLDSTSKDEMIGGVYYLVTDLQATSSQIHSFIYDDQKPQ